MRLVVFSDIHGNLEALEAFIQETADLSADLFVCLGDIVGYGACPNECMERLAALPDLRVVLGNHDAAAIWQSSPYEMTPNAQKAILWTIDQLTGHHSDRIKTLDEIVHLDPFVFCHANPYHPSGWRYMTGWFHCLRSFFATRGRITFVGHTHRPKVITQSQGFKIDIANPPEGGRIVLDAQHRYIVNCGAIGQPRDGNPDGGYVLYDSNTDAIEFRRFEYDIESAARRIGDAGLPSFLADRLFKGR